MEEKNRDLTTEQDRLLRRQEERIDEIHRELHQQIDVGRHWEYQATHDALTGILNRQGFRSRVAETDFSKESVGLVLFDVDDFKRLNDTYGHDVGDRVLAEVATLLSEQFRKDDIVFRLGGDEFGVLMRHCDASVWNNLCNKIRNVHLGLRNRFAQDSDVTISGGVCFTEKGMYDALYAIADEALYETKRKQRAGITLIDEEHRILKHWRDDQLTTRTKNVLNRTSTGVFRAEIPKDPSQASRMICSEMTKVILGVPSDATPEECYRIWFERVDKTFYEALAETKATILSGEQAECTYRWKHPGWGTITMRSGGIGTEKEDGLYFYGYHYVLLDSENVQQKDSSRKIVDALSNVYFASFFIDLPTKSFVVLKSMKYAKELLLKSTNVETVLDEFLTHLVLPEHAEKMRKFCNLGTLSERIREQAHIDCEYESREKGHWCQASFLPVEFDEDGNVTNVLFVITELDEEKTKKRAQESLAHELLQIQQQTAELITSSDIIGVAMIDKETGMARMNETPAGMTKHREYSLERIAGEDLPFTTEEQRQIIRESISLDKLRACVEEHGHYVISAGMLDNNNEYHYITHHFAAMRDDSHILMVVEDNTKSHSVDEITGSMNKNGFVERVKLYAQRHPEHELAMLCFDIRKFKAVNSRYGFAVGDRILKEVMLHLQGSSLKPIFVCRETADIFFALMEKKYFEATEIETVCRMYTNVGNTRIPVMMDCGGYLMAHRREDVAEACDKARMACHAGRTQVETQYCEYNDVMNREYLEAAYVTEHFEEAINNRQFKVAYQPIYRVADKTIVSAEALVRWNHPAYGYISPGSFLPAVVQSGHIPELDRYVGARVWEMLAARLAKNRAVVPVSVNMSRYNFFQSYSAGDIADMVAAEPRMHELIRVEITESGLEDIRREGLPLLKALRNGGTKILVDDFGSGYSSLGMLAECDCDIVKLDMSFARSIGKNAKAEVIVSGIIEVIHNMGMEVVAEGVETKEQYEFLRDNGCDYLQGYYFAKPMMRECFEELLDTIESETIISEITEEGSHANEN